MPAYVLVTDGKTADNKGAYDIPLLKNSIIVADRFYNEVSLLHVWDSSKVYSVVRHKKNLQYESIWENELPNGRHQPILKDDIIGLMGLNTRKSIPALFAGWMYGTPRMSR